MEVAEKILHVIYCLGIQGQNKEQILTCMVLYLWKSTSLEYFGQNTRFFIESYNTMKKILNVHIYEVCKLIIDNIVNKNTTDCLGYTFRAKTLLFNVKHFLVFLFNWYQLPPKFDLLSVFNKFFDHWDLTIFFLLF